MSERRIYIDRAPGETRGVVTLDDRPERLIVQRDEDDRGLAVGARHIARVRRVEKQMGSAFLELDRGAEAILPFKPDAVPVQGEALEVEVRSEPRRDKLATVRALGPAQGDPRLAAAAPELAEQLRHLAKGAEVEEGRAARDIADEAEAEALEVGHPLPGGGRLWIEPTRALTAVDIDLGARQGADVKRVTRQANLTALAEAARLLRLKSLGGLIVIDLVGRGHDAAALLAAARTAYGPDNPGVTLGPISRFGTLELTVPRRSPPLHERLCGPSGAPTDRTLAQRLIRVLERESQAHPGGRLEAACAPGVAEAVLPLAMRLARTIGPRFEVVSDPDLPRGKFDVRVA